MTTQLESARYTAVFALVLLLQGLWPAVGQAMPEFARKYNMSCVACHAAFPRLNQFGEYFADNNMRRLHGLPHGRYHLRSGRTVRPRPGAF